MSGARLFPAERAEIFVGELLIFRKARGVFFSHRADRGREDLTEFCGAESAAEIARFDAAGKFRSLKTAPNLRRDWRLMVRDENEARVALEHFYPGRLAIFEAWQSAGLTTTCLRETLARQTGMYRVAAKISDEEADQLVGEFCQSATGCLRTILWKRDAAGTIASARLPAEKFDPTREAFPLLCQEACNLLVAAAREKVKSAHE